MQTGNLAEARRQAAELLHNNPAFSLDSLAETHAYLLEPARMILLDSVKLAMDNSQPREKLRIV